MKPKVYLAGPIAGLSFDDATTWRILAKGLLADSGIDAYSPLRNKEYFKDINKFENKGYEEFPLSTSKAVVCRDFLDCTTSNVVIVYLLGAKSISIGTVMEIAWAYQARVPIILVMEKDNLHSHCMVNECANFKVDNLEDAINIAKSVLLP